jgi:DNA-binding beta-propeller fold protein YncE
VGGIASDDKGYIYVTDQLKSVVMIFDKDFRFQVQFGYRGNNRDNLIAPQQLEVLGDKLFVNQARKRGISVFRISYD